MAIKIAKQKNGLYTVRVWATHKDAFGKRKTKQKTNIKTFASAENYGNKFQEELDCNDFYNENMIFPQLASLYEDSKINMSVTTKNQNKEIKSSVLSYLGNVKLKDINTRIVQAYINKLANTPNKNNPTQMLKKGTIQRRISYIKAVINWAVGQDILEYNKIKRLEYPEDIEEFEPTILSPIQIGEILKYLKQECYNIYIPVLLDACLGTRRGESLGLTWDMIDFENNLIYIKKNLVQVNNDVILKNKLKTQKSKRVQAISEFLSQELLEHKNMCKYLNSDFVCANVFTGKVPNPKYVTKTFHKTILDKFNIDMRLHDLRHCFNHMANENNTDIVTMVNMLGHSNIKTNLLYAGYSKDKMKVAVDKISENIQRGFNNGQ